jgi:hypothetical protein
MVPAPDRSARLMEKNRAEKLKEARETIVWADETPFQFRAETVAAAGYFLLDEVDRLSGLEKKILGLIKEASDEIDELNEDYEAASDADCDHEVFERIQGEIGRAHAKLKVLSSLLG